MYEKLSKLFYKLSPPEYHAEYEKSLIATVPIRLSLK